MCSFRCIRFLKEVYGISISVFFGEDIVEHNILRVFDIISTFGSGGGRLNRLDGYFSSFYLQRADSWIVAFIGVRCLWGPSFENVDLFDVGSEAVKSFVSLTLNAIVFKGEVDLHECISEYTIDIIRFDETIIDVGSQRLHIVCAFDFA